MRQIVFAVMLGIPGCPVLAQDDIVACQRNAASRSDSLTKAGEDPFEIVRKCALNKSLPPFKLVTLNGDTIRSKQTEGKIVVINFWFIDCHPCMAEIPGMNKLVAEYKGRNVEFLAITLEPIKRLREEFLTKYKLDFVIIPEAGKFINKVSASGFPTTYVLDTRGIIREAWNGGSIDDNAGDIYYEKAKPVIDGLLKAQ